VHIDDLRNRRCRELGEEVGREAVVEPPSDRNRAFAFVADVRRRPERNESQIEVSGAAR
jgi:hypothetical protein